MEGVIGEIRMFAGNFAPGGWFLCQGQQLAISQYDTLFTVLGTTFGGDGQTTFALPDLRGRVAMGSGAGGALSPRTFGESAGGESNTLTASQLPAHSHAAQGTAVPHANKSNGTMNTPVANFPAVATDINSYDTATDAQMGSSNVAVTVSPSGGSQPMNNIQPFQVVNYMICYEGIYPDRS